MIVKSILAIVASLVASASVIYGCILFIDSRIEHATNDEQFIRRVSSHVRPYVIFDVNSSILVDGGAMQYLETLEVEERDKRRHALCKDSCNTNRSPCIPSSYREAWGGSLNTYAKSQERDWPSMDI